jgi:hypothetical protein
MKTYLAVTVLAAMMLSGCVTTQKETESPLPSVSAYQADVDFLKKYGTVIELTDSLNQSKVAVMGALQGRVMTSTSGEPGGSSYGWINKQLFESGDTSSHINAFGGEERFWLGPEGGQFSIFFEKGKQFNLDNWHTPAVIDIEPYDLVKSTKNSARFSKSTVLKNYSGTTFDLTIDRTIRVLEKNQAFKELGIDTDTAVNAVAYESNNILTNNSPERWSKKTGLLSIWLLGMFNPSPSMAVVIPYNKTEDAKAGTIVNDDYFGKVPAERLKITDDVIYFRGDGQFRSKIGLSPVRAKDVFGSYDDSTKTLTIVKYSKKEGAVDYVNSKWEIQSDPFRGDVINSYNDGPPAPGTKPLGPFYELETSSHSEELQEDETLVHRQVTFHFTGSEEALNNIAQNVLGVSLEQIRAAFR